MSISSLASQQELLARIADHDCPNPGACELYSLFAEFRPDLATREEESFDSVTAWANARLRTDFDVDLTTNVDDLTS